MINGGRKLDEYRCVNAVKMLFVLAVQAVLSNVECFDYTVSSRSQTIDNKRSSGGAFIIYGQTFTRRAY